MEENEQLENQEIETEIQTDPIADKAKAMGWVPKEEFRGDPTRWTDAQAFVERGENILPVLKERLDHVIKENKEIKEAQKEFLDYHKKTAKREYDRALQTVQQRKLDAVQDADVDGYQKAEQEERELLKESPPVKQNEPKPEFVDFLKNNDWYQSDPDMRAYADNMGVFISSTKNLEYGDVLKEVEKEVKARYPGKFQNQRRESADSVERSPDTGLPVKQGKTFNDLPADAKAACEKFMRNIPGFTKEQYLKDYFG